MMKKITNLKLANLLLGSGLFLIASGSAFAKQVPVTNAKSVAENFFHQYSESATGELSYTSLDAQGNPLFYVFNINGNSGFVIVSAEDAGRPIIGYSNEQGFQKPDPKSSASFWLSQRENELTTLRNKNTVPSAAISAKWDQYLTSHVAARTSNVTSNIIVAPLVQSKWNQSPFYNADCPGNSVTGCVATTMAQIMRYWTYPNKGVGSSSYCDCTNSGFPNNYGTLSANFGTTTYNWSNMPLANITTANTDIAQLMFQCGVSVHMNYDPTGSSAAVLSSDSPISAQNAYVNYFNYDPNTISGVYRNNYSDADWLALLKADLDISRPIQYAGFGSDGGHTWVCDGYDNNNLFHMNWGWGGQSDGYFDVDGLNPSGMDFNSWQQGLFGILPLASNGLDGGVVSISPAPSACSGSAYLPSVKIRNFGYDDLNTCTISYKLDNGTVQTVQWSGDLVTGQAADITIPALSLTSGAHVLSVSITNLNSGSTDVNSTNDQSSYSFALFSQGTLPLSEGFEVPAQTTNHWSVIPSQNGSDWQFTTQGFSGGAQSIMINNLANTPGNTSTLMGLDNFDFAVLAQPYFHFKVAYQQKTSASNDKLTLQISSDCGSTWHAFWSKQGAALASTGVLSSSPFAPATTDFVEYAIPGPITHNSILRWVFTADAAAPGNNVYLDDINLGDGKTVGIHEISTAANSFEVYPNPASGETFVQFSLDNASSLEVNVTDISGRIVMNLPKTAYTAGPQTVSINKNNSLTSGIYMVTISADGVKSSRKLIVQ